MPRPSGALNCRCTLAALCGGPATDRPRTVGADARQEAREWDSCRTAPPIHAWRGDAKPSAGRGTLTTRCVGGQCGELPRDPALAAQDGAGIEALLRVISCGCGAPIALAWFWPTGGGRLMGEDEQTALEPREGAVPATQAIGSLHRRVSSNWMVCSLVGGAGLGCAVGMGLGDNVSCGGGKLRGGT